MHIILITLAITFLAALLVSVFALGNRKQKLQSFFFGMYFLGFILWAGGIFTTLFMSLSVPGEFTFTFGDKAYFIEQLIFLAPVIFFTGNLFFVYTYPENKLPKSIWHYWPLLLSIPTGIIVFIPNSLFTTVTIYPEGYAILDMGPFTGLYSLFLLTHYIYTAIVLGLKKHRAKSMILYEQFYYLFWAHIVTFILMITINWILPIFFGIFSLNSFGPVLTFISVGTFAYAVTHYRFLDLRISFQRVLTYATSVLILITFAWFFANASALSRFNILLIDTVTVLTVIVTFLPLKKFLHRLFNLLIFRELKNYHERLRELVLQIGRSGIHLEEAVARILTALRQTLDLQQCRFLPAEQLAAIGGAHQFLLDHDDILYSEELEYRALREGDSQAKELAAQMKKNSVSVLAPIRKNGELAGALAIQPKPGMGIFSGGQLEDISWVAENAALYFVNLKSSNWKDLSNIQHEVNSPLARALIRTESLRDKMTTKDTRKKVAEIMQDIFQSSRVFYHFLEIQSLPKNKKVLNQRTQLKPVVKKAIEKLKWELFKRNLDFTPQITVSNSKKITVSAQPILLEEIITELLLNAVLFGNHKVTLKTADLGKNALVKISNLGNLNAVELKRALTKFGSFGKYRGGGLGLNFVQVFADTVGGSFTLRSIRGQVIAELELPKITETI